MSTEMKERFVTELRSNVAAWREDEIDFATFNECQRDTWQAIHAAGPEIAAAVLRELSGDSPAIGGSPPTADNRRTKRYRAVKHAASRHDERRYRAEIQRTAAGSPVLQLTAIRGSAHREMAAFIYELAAHMERLSQQLSTSWLVSPEVWNSRVIVEIVDDDEMKLADEVLANIISNHQLA